MKTYPLFKVHIPQNTALANVGKVFESGFINEGVQVTELTHALSRRMQTDKLSLVNSCTSALTLALKLSGVGPGDEVITTPMTCVATNTPIITAGAKVVWADVDPNTGMLDVQDVKRKITEKTKAVMAVAWAGAPPDLFGLGELCDLSHGHNVGKPKLILDAAHAFDATFLNRPVHEFATFTCYSFQAIKHFTTGDGGALVCLNEVDHVRAKALKWFGLDRDHAKDEKGDWKGQQWDVDIVEAGYKFNMNNVAAAIGLSQIKHIDKIISAHRMNAMIYQDRFENFNLFEGFKSVVPIYEPENVQSSHWVYTMKVNPTYSRLTRDELLKELNAEGIMAGVVHVPNDDYTAFKDSITDLPGVRSFSSRQFSLPCGWWLTQSDIEHIANRVKELTK